MANLINTDVSAEMAVRESVLAYLTAAEQPLRVIEWESDSMEPTIRRGDLVIVDTRERTPLSESAIFALHDGFGEVLKRLEVVPNSEPTLVRISSDNPKYPWHYEAPLTRVAIVGRYRGRLTKS